MKEFDSVVLTRDVPEHGLRAGDVGAIVHVSAEYDVYEVEFFNVTGDTIAILTLQSADIRLPQSSEVVHVRRG